MSYKPAAMVAGPRSWRWTISLPRPPIVERKTLACSPFKGDSSKSSIATNSDDFQWKKIRNKSVIFSILFTARPSRLMTLQDLLMANINPPIANGRAWNRRIDSQSSSRTKIEQPTDRNLTPFGDDSNAPPNDPWQDDSTNDVPRFDGDLDPRQQTSSNSFPAFHGGDSASTTKKRQPRFNSQKKQQPQFRSQKEAVQKANS